MKVLVLYRPNSEFSRGVEEFVKDLQTQHGVNERNLQVLDYDSRDGASTASMYDLMNQPAILVTGDDGRYVKHWEGPNLPLLSEVAGYTFQYS
jgi:cyanophycinase-like exopeptidase